MTTRAATPNPASQPGRSPGAAAVPNSARPVGMLAMLRNYLFPQRGMAALMAALLLGAVGLQLLVPQLLRRFIDTALASGAAGVAEGAATQTGAPADLP